MPDETVAPQASAVSTVVQFPTPSTFSTQFAALQSFICKWFHSPDLEAHECCLTAVASHLITAAEPVWPVVVGPSGSGKTTICVMPYHSLVAPFKSHLVGDMTPSTFLSCKKGSSNSLLHRIGSGLILMKDFTTILSKRENDRNEIVAQLREVYDGSFSRQSGNGPTQPWSGKITLVGAATPAIYRAWQVLREMGERFMFINWPAADDDGVARMVDRQITHEREIASTLRGITQRLLSCLPPALTLPDLTESQSEQIRAMAIVAARCRAHVTRDSNGKREIIDTPAPEGIGRLYKSLSLIARTHAAMFDRSAVDADDIRISRRLAKDAIPLNRWRLVSHIPGGSDISRPSLQHLTRIPMSTLVWNAEELIALGVIEQVPIEYEDRYTLAPEMEQRVILAGFQRISTT